jgi:hypothetical protein
LKGKAPGAVFRAKLAPNCAGERDNDTIPHTGLLYGGAETLLQKLMSAFQTARQS